MLSVHKRGMKMLNKYLFNPVLKNDAPMIFYRTSVGNHLSLPLHQGKSNSVVVAITHSKLVGNAVKTIQCDFSAISKEFTTNISNKLFLKEVESRSLLMIVSNNTLNVQNTKQLNKLIYKTGLHHSNEQQRLVNKILTEKKLTYISNFYNQKDTHILYQTKYKNELISIDDSKRLIQLVGHEVYDEFFFPLIDLSSITNDNPGTIANILMNKADKEGLVGVLNIIKIFNT